MKTSHLISVLAIVSLSNVTCFEQGYGFSTYCQPCIAPCQQDPEGKYFWCKTYNWDFNGEVYDWDYCSLNSEVDNMGINCTSVCAFYGERYQWCTSGEDWGYCSGDFCTKNTIELPNYGYSTYCQQCITPCQRTKSDYYWCGTRQWKFSNKTWAWDYCSPNSGVDYQGNRCLNKCKFRDGQLYQWCKNANGTGYCSGNVLCDFLPSFE